MTNSSNSTSNYSAEFAKHQHAYPEDDDSVALSELLKLRVAGAAPMASSDHLGLAAPTAPVARIALSRALAAAAATALPGGGAAPVDAYARSAVMDHGLAEPFYVIDLGVVARRFAGWAAALPRVTPFYAVKCCPDPAFLAVLAALGAGFDVASQKELEMVMAALGGTADPGRIIYANPCKMPRQLAFAAAAGVTLTTFDSVDELAKIAAVAPGSACVLRLKADDPAARCSFGHKFGALLSEAPGLIRTAVGLGLDLAGVSFHIGSGGASDPTWLVHAIGLSRQVFDVAAGMGVTMRLLDIGGGFSGGHGTLAPVAVGINAALEAHFPASSGVRVIAEPGRYFAEAAATLAVNVYGTRSRADAEGPTADYWVTDGVYGSMNCILYDHAVLSARPLADPTKFGSNDCLESRPALRSTVFGPTCDGLDTLLRGTPLPRLECGDWLLFESMGAYTWSAGSSFNGFGRGEAATGGCAVRSFYVVTQHDGAAPEVPVAVAESPATVAELYKLRAVRGRGSGASLGGPETPEISAGDDEAAMVSGGSGDEAESGSIVMASPSW